MEIQCWYEFFIYIYFMIKSIKLYFKVESTIGSINTRLFYIWMPNLTEFYLTTIFDYLLSTFYLYIFSWRPHVLIISILFVSFSIKSLPKDYDLPQALCDLIQYIRKNINIIFFRILIGIVKDLNLFFHYNLKILLLV